MRNKFIFILMALAVFVGVFSMTAFADSGQETLNVNEAWIVGDTLKIDVTDTKSGANSTLELNLKDYDLSREYISVQAADAEGNKSNTVQIKNPYYVAPETEQTESALPKGAFTPDGEGTVIDNVGDNGSKEFFTIKTAADNTFFLVIDRKRDSDNVYFLNAITEADLLEMAQKNKSGSTTSAIPTPEPTEQEPGTSPEPTTAPQSAQDSGSGFMIFIVIGVILAGGAGWYFKVYLPKQKSADNYEADVESDDEYFDEDENGDDEDGDNE